MIQLEFTTTDIQNSILSDEGDKFYYEILCPEWQPHVTTLKRLNSATGKYMNVAEIENTLDRKSRPAAVKIVGEPSKLLDEFLHPVEDGRSWNIKAKDDITYQWITNGGHLELIRLDTPNTPLVVHHREKKFAPLFSTTGNPKLDVDPSLSDIMDFIVLSFIVVERLRRYNAGYLSF
ncbi:hypothetical protein BDN71DRAFT_1439138 [Pleurotus eryngii]|uniref:DUF6593 domain-containing protein n=1 Tax=Pleurotus eryngii TaxID=5323 RepID=A0A9P6A8H0_PLEER|nr:hypothetical protein BDN71DRAFT_1439138 [Pleurotus eryngii]